MYVVQCTCAYYAYITFSTLVVYVCSFHVCSVEGVRGRASEMTERRPFYRRIPLGLDLTPKEEKLPPFLARRVNDKFPIRWARSWCPTSNCQQQLQLQLVLTLSLCNYFTSVVISTCRGYVFDSFILWCVLGCRFIWSFCKEHLFSLSIFKWICLEFCWKGFGSLGSIYIESVWGH